MEILRIAVTSAPKKSKIVLRKITENDKKISSLVAKFMNKSFFQKQNYFDNRWNWFFRKKIS